MQFLIHFAYYNKNVYLYYFVNIQKKTWLKVIIETTYIILF